MRRVIGGLADIIAITAVGVALVVALVVGARAGENQAAKWHKAGFACIFNQDGTTNCRFDVDAKNKLNRMDQFNCKVRVEFTSMTWKGSTGPKQIKARDWKRLGAEAKQVPEGEIVDHIKWRCWRIN